MRIFCTMQLRAGLVLGLILTSSSAEMAKAAPVAKAQTVITTEDTPAIITLTGASKTGGITGFRVVGLPGKGALYQTDDGVTQGDLITKVPAQVTSGEGKLIYVPPANAAGNPLTAFQFGADEDAKKSRAVVVKIVVTPVNDAPTAEPDTVIASRTKPTNIAVLGNDRDVDGDRLKVVRFTQPSSGKVTLNANGTLRFVPDSRSAALPMDTFTYTVEDGHGEEADAGVVLVFDQGALQSWPMMGNTSAHTGSTVCTLGKQTYREAWSLPIREGALQPASIALGKVFVTEDNRFDQPPTVRAVDLNTGSVSWVHSFNPANSLTGPSFANGHLFVQRCNNYPDTELWCLDALTGTTVWSSLFSAQWESYLPPTIYGSSVFMDGGAYGGMYGFIAGTGEQLFFDDELPQYDGWTPTVTDGRVLSFTEGVLREHHQDTGKVLWSLDLGWNWNGYTMNRTVTASGGMAWVITNNVATTSYDLVAVNLATHKESWRSKGSFVIGTPAVAGGIVYAIAEYGDDPFSTVVKSFDGATGKALRTFVTPNGACGFQPVVTQDMLVVSGSNGTYLFDIHTGNLVQQLDKGGIISVVTSRIVIAGSDGVLRCYAVPLPGNHPPIASATTATGNEDTDLLVKLGGTDADKDALTAVVKSLPDKGFLYQTTDGGKADELITSVPTTVTNRDGKVVYRPLADQSGVAYTSFKFCVFDGKDMSAIQPATINITPVNDPPTALDDLIAISAGGTFETFSPLINDFDVDGDSLTLVSFTQASPLVITKNTDGTLKITCPAGTAEGSSFSFTYTVRDPSGAQASAKVTVEVSKTSHAEEWNTLGHDATHASFYPRPLGTSPKVERWSISLDHASTPLAVAEGKVFSNPSLYFSSGNALALDAVTGAEVWRAPIKKSYSISAPSYFDGAAYFLRGADGSDTPELVANYSADGTEKWRAPFSSQWGYSLAPAVTTDGVFIGGNYGAFYGFNKDTGSQRFHLDVEQTDGWTPAMENGKLYTFVGNTFCRHDPLTGEIVASINLGGSNSGSMARTVAVSSGHAFLVNQSLNIGPDGYSTSSELVGLDAVAATVRWRVSGAFTGTPAVANNIVYANVGSQVKAFSATDGHYLRSFGQDSTGYGRTMARHLAITADLVISGDSTDTYLFNRQTGALVQAIPVAGYAVVAYDSVYIAADDQTIRCYGSPSPPGNHAPITNAGQITTLEDTSSPLQLTATDADGDTLTWVVESLPTGGKLYQTTNGTTKGSLISAIHTRVANASGWLIFEPSANLFGAGVGRFTFAAYDQFSGSAQQTFNVNITPVNDPPVAHDDFVALRAGETLSDFRPQLNDNDADNDADNEVLTVVAVTQGAHGSVAINARTSITYIPQPAFTSGTDTFNYTIQDAAGVDASAKVTITIVGKLGTEWPTMGGGPDHTSFVPDSLGTSALTQRWAVNLGKPAYQVAVVGGRVFSSSISSFSDSALIASDQSSGAELWRATTPSSYYGLNPPSVFDGHVFMQRGNHSASNLVAYDVVTGALTWTAPFRAQWEHYLAPAVDSTGIYVNGGSYGGIYGFNTSTGANKFFVSLQQVDGWTPALYGTGLYSFVDGVFRSHNRTTGAVEWSQDFTWKSGVTMNRTVACADSAAFFINDPQITNGISHRDLICMDLVTQHVRWSLGGDFSAATPAIAPGRVFAIAGGGSTVQAFDTGSGRLLATYSAPSEVGLFFQPIITNDVVIASSNSKTYVFDVATSALRQTIGFGGYISFAGRSLYIASGDNLVRCFGVPDPTNAAPVVLPLTVTTPEDTDMAVTLSGNDSDPLKMIIASLPAKGALYQTSDGHTRGTAITNTPALVTNAAGSVIYSPPTNANGTAFTSFGYEASDGVNISTSQAVTIHVTPVNDPPVAVPDVRSLAAGQILSPLAVLANDYDIDGDPLTIMSFTQPAHGTVTQNSDGSLRYVPQSGAVTSTDTFTYTIGDGQGGSSSATVTLNVVPPGQGTWSTYGGDVSHTGYVPGFLGAGTWQKSWTYPAVNVVGAAMAEGKVFITFNSTEVAALSAATGAKVWQTSVASGASDRFYNVINAPAWFNGRVYLVQGQQNYTGVISLNSDTGAQQWRKPVGNQGERYLAPTVSDLGVFFNAGSYGGMYGFEFAGTQRFIASGLPQVDEWTPAIHQGRLYSFLRGTLRNHSLSTGATLWSATVATGSYYNLSSYRTLACADGVGVVVNDGTVSSLAAFDLTAHTLKWTAPGTFIGTPAVSNGSAFALTTSGVEEHSMTDGRLLGKYSSAFSSYTSGLQPVVTDDLVIFAAHDGIRVFNRYTRALTQIILETGGVIALADNQLIVITASGVSAYSPPPMVTLAPAGGTFATAVPVKLTTSVTGGVIRYTTDGSAPGLSSPSIASGDSVAISQTGKLRVIVVNESFVSNIYEGSYVIGPAAPSPAPALARPMAPIATTGALTANSGPNSFKILQSTRTGSQLHLTWAGQAGTSYVVECSPDLIHWTVVSPSLEGVTGTMNFDPSIDGPTCFFRIRTDVTQ